MPDLVQELKQLIIDTLNLDDISVADIGTEDPLFGQGLGLDSIDALELAVAIERRYHVAIPDEEVGKQAFRSVAALANFLTSYQEQQEAQGKGSAA